MTRIFYFLMLVIFLSGCGTNNAAVLISDQGNADNIEYAAEQAFGASNPASVKYFQRVRKKIEKNTLALFWSYASRKDEGRVSVSFVVLPDGRLEESAIEFLEGSSPNNILRNIARLGLKNSAPFKPFPKALLQKSPESVNFKISIDFQLKGDRKKRKIYPRYIGIFMFDINDDITEIYNLESKEGIFIQDVIKESPAEKAGLEEGDIILSVNKTKIGSIEDFRKYLKRHSGEIALTTNRGEFLVERDIEEF